KASQGREAAEAALQAAASSREECQREHDRLHGADLVGSLTKDLHPGDPCPVCSRPLERIPVADAKVFARAGRALDRATQAEATASSVLHEAERDVTAVERDADAARREVERCDRELEACKEERAGIAEAASSSFDGELPTDPVAEVEARVA